MKCKDCNYDCARRGEGETECFYEIEMRNQKEAKEAPYWRKFRAEAAKDILCSMIQSGYYGEDRIVHHSELAVKYIDELMKQLKEKEEK